MKYQHGLPAFKKWRHLQEQQRITKFAPRISCKGPHIRNSENLCRLIFFPDHVHPTNNTIREESISRDDLTRRGFSIFRVGHTDRPDIDIVINGYLAKNNARALLGLATFYAAEIREINDNRKDYANIKKRREARDKKSIFQAFVIQDSADEKHLRGHAVILCSREHPKSKVKELRHELAKLLASLKPLNQIIPP